MFRSYVSVSKFLKGSICGALASVVWIFPAHAEPLDVLISERPPYYLYDADKGVSGIVAGRAAEAFTMAGLDVRWTVVSFNRQLRMVAENQGPYCGIGWFKNAEREKFAKFTTFIYQDKALVALSRADNISVSAHNNLRGLMSDATLTMGMKLGFSYGAHVDVLTDELSPRSITTDQSSFGMARMLIGGRFDYMITAPEEAVHVIGQLGVEGEQIIMMALLDLPPQNKRYIMCSRKVDDDIIEKLNAVIPKVR